ncbi:MAG: peptidase M23 [Anderseniella sp.]|nr:peptidase M23 [Anderseniella sp.]
MTRLAAAITALALTSLPAIAHDGVHLHPHGIEAGWTMLAIVAALVAGGTFALWRR